MKPPKWTFTLEPATLQVGEKATLVMEAEIPMGWYVYSNDFDKDLGPLLTEFVPAESGDFSISSKLKAINPKKKYDEVWEGDVTYFIGKGRFEQPITINATSGTVKGSLEYQMCSDLTGQCINYEQDIEIEFTAKEANRSAASEEAAVESDLAQEAEKPITDSSDTEKVQEESPFSIIPSPAFGEAGQQGGEAGQLSTQTQDFTAEGETESLWGFMVLAFLAGLAALITPCVFPMIPMTVSFFTGRSKSRAQGIRQAFIYGISIIGIYTIAGTAVAAIQGPEFANWLATHWIPNVFFFGIFIVFALAFLGMFELTLPSSFVNKIDTKAEKGALEACFLWHLHWFWYHFPAQDRS